MIKSLTIKNFQSHRDTTLNLGAFTVIVGPSDVGKSAIARSLKALASNISGKDFITNGEVTSQIMATTDRGTITLTKGKPEDSYVLLTNDDPNPRRYTKLGGSVPPDVTDFLGIEPKDAINFASQLDMPYLLRTSASEVARTLGDLTNVSVIFEASREALRRKTSFSATYRTREGDLATLEPRLSRYDDLPARRSAIERAEKAFNAAQNAQNRLQRLEDVLLTLQTASARLRAAESATGPLPDIERLLSIYNRYKALSSTLTALQSASSSLASAEASSDEAATQIENLSVEYDNALHEAGTCPTCGQSTLNTHRTGHTHG